MDEVMKKLEELEATMAAEPLIIQMQNGRVHGSDSCCNCGMPCSHMHGLPMFEGEIVPNDWEGEWGGFPACERCFDDHQSGRGVFQTPGPWRPAQTLVRPETRWRRNV